MWPTEAPTSEAAVDAISTWIGTFGHMDWVVTDQGTHFTSSVVKHLVSDFKLRHHFTTAYCPWANGSVERICNEVIRASRAVLSELQLSPKHWQSILECIQSIINQEPLKRLGLRNEKNPSMYRTPLEVFTIHRPKRPLLRALLLSGYRETPSLQELRVKEILEIGKIQDTLDKMRKEVNQRAEKTSKTKAEA